MNPIKSSNNKLHYGYVIVLSSFLLMALSWGTLYSFGVFFKPLLNEFGWSRSLTSSAFSISMLVYGFCAVFAGKINDRFGPRTLLSICGLLLGSALILMSRITAEWQLFLIYGLLIGIGISGFFIPLISTVARWFRLRRGIMTGLTLSGAGVGVLVMPQLVGLLINSYGWRTAYVIIGCLNLVLMFLIARFLVQEPSKKGLLPVGEGLAEVDVKDLQADSYTLPQALRMRQFWVLCTVLLFFGFILQVIMVHIVPHATDLSITDSAAAGILATIGAVSIGGRISMGTISDKIGNKSSAMICFCVLLTALVWLQFSTSIWTLYVFAALFGFGYGGFAPSSSLLVAEMFGLRSHGAILGSTEIAYTIGAAIGPFLAGSIFDSTGSYGLAFLACSIFSVIAIATLSSVKPGQLIKAFGKAARARFFR